MNEISDEDKKLWQATIGESLEKPKPKPAEESFAALLNAPLVEKSEKKTKSLEPIKPPIKINHSEPLDKTIERKLKQGKITPDYTLDLHGLNQQYAHQKLNHTIETAYHTGKNIILVITGKGKGQAKAEEWITKGQGVLKSKLPEWVKTPPLKNFVIDAIPAHAKHGGSGAYYIIIRKKK